MTKVPYDFSMVPYRDADPDPDWIRIQSGQWIQIRNPDPDPGGQKCPTKVEIFFKVHVLKCWMAEGFFCNLDVLYGGLRRGK
jgi:hypothetical protein